MHQQDSIMLCDPANRTLHPYPSHATQYRGWHGQVAWLYNPWTGAARDPLDIGTDVFGRLIIPPGEPVYAAAGAS